MHEKFMAEALAEARKASALGEVPVGAVVVVDDKIISRAHNLVEEQWDATCHAELLAIRHASEQLSSWRLDRATLYVTLEPCSMCVGAMILARVKTLVFGAFDPMQGAVGSAFDLSQLPVLPHQLEVISGVCAVESEMLLKDFFQHVRKSSKL